MKVILTDDVLGLGDIGQTVKVRPGYGRNFLIPRKLALEVGSSSAREIAHRMKQIEVKRKRLKSIAESEAASFSAHFVELELKVGTGGRVFGSISARDIAEKLTEKGLMIDRRRILLHEPIKKIGQHKVRVKLHPEVQVDIPVNIKAVAADKEQEVKETQEARQIIEEKVAAKGSRKKKIAEEPQKEQQELE